jgi:hypothetical protein
VHLAALTLEGEAEVHPLLVPQVRKALLLWLVMVALELLRRSLVLQLLTQVAVEEVVTQLLEQVGLEVVVMVALLLH